MSDENGSSGLGFKGVLIGLILMPLSFVVVYWSALRTQASDVLEDAIPVSQSEQAIAKKQPFYATGTIRPRKIGDKEYLADGAPLLKLQRKVEVYSWYAKKKEGDTKKVEYGKKKKKGKKKAGFKCEKAWIEKPKKDKDFEKACADKPFFEKKIQGKKEKIAQITIKDKASGKEYAVAEKDLSIDISSAELKASALEKYIVEGSNLVRKGDSFYDKTSCGDPVEDKKFGCHRITFLGIIADDAAEYTVIGGSMSKNTELDRDQIGPLDAKGKSFLKLCKGDKKICMGELAKSDRSTTWFGLIASIVLFAASLLLMTGPISGLIEKIPVVGGLGSGLLKFALVLFAAFIMSLFFFLFKFWYIVLGAFVVLVVVLVVLKKKG